MSEIISTGFKLAGQAYSIYNSYEAAQTQKDAAKDAKRAAEITAHNAKLKGVEEKRKLEKELAYEQGLARARAGASGVSMGGTVAAYLADLKAEGAKDLEWLLQVTDSEIQTALAGGNLDALQLEAGASASMASAWSTVPQLAEDGYDAYQQYT